jgi:hypothetical protein
VSAPDLDAWLPDPAVRTLHRRTAAAPAADLWRCAQQLRLDEVPRLGRLVRWRIPGLRPGIGFGELFREPPFAVLEEGERHLLSGVCGRIWTLQRDYGRLEGAEEFRAWSEPGTVRVLFANWVEDEPSGRAALCSEARVAPVDRRAALRLRALWAVTGVFERLIGAEGLALAARCAERGAARGVASRP